MKLLRFGRNELDLERYQLRRAGIPLHLSRMPFDLLTLLIQRRGLLVTREEIAAHLWVRPDGVDTVGGINTAIKKIRSVLNDNPEKPRFIETVTGRGYRFIGDVAEVAQEEQPVLTPPVEFPLAPVRPSLENVLLQPVVEPPSPHPVALSAGRRNNRVLILGLALAACLLIFWGASRRPSSIQPLYKTQITTNNSENLVLAAAISPDGGLLAYADAFGLWLRVLESGETHRIRMPENAAIDRIAWFPDRLQLLLSVTEHSTGQPDIWRASLFGSAPVLVRENARTAAPSPDGHNFAFLSVDGKELWVVDSVKGQDRRVLSAGPESVFDYPFWSRDGKRLAYEERTYEPTRLGEMNRDLETQYLWKYGCVDISSGRLIATERGVRFDSASYTRDGRLLFLRAAPPRDAAALGFWEVGVNPETGAFLSKPRLKTAVRENRAYGMTATDDGTKLTAIVHAEQADVFVGDLEHSSTSLTNVRRLTLDTRADYPHAWTSDARSIIFESDREGEFRLYRQSLDEHVPEPIVTTSEPQSMAQITSNGEWILYSSASRTNPHIQSLRRVSAKGGESKPLPLNPSLDEFRCPLNPGAGCVLRETVGHDYFAFYNLDPVTGKGAELRRTTWTPNVTGDWALSPDASRIALPIHEAADPRVRIIPLRDGAAEIELPIKAPLKPWGLNWAADGKGWFAQLRSPSRHSLVYINDQGDPTVLREAACDTWGVPSPDGKRLALADCEAEHNVWMWK